MNDLPTRYTALVAKRPELAVASLFFEPSVMWGSWYRSNTGRPVNLHDTDARDDWRAIHTDEASALIFRRMCEAIPHARALVRMFDKWAIATVIVGSTGETSDWHPDPLSALFAYWEAQ